jgi:hypothetical protein
MVRSAVPAFVVVEFQGLSTPALDYIRSHPGLRADFLLELPPPEATGDVRVLVQVAGPQAERDGLHALLAKQYGLRDIAPVEPGTWLASLLVPVQSLVAPLRAMAGFGPAHGMPLLWGRVEEGIVYARMLLGDPERAQELAQRLRGFTEAAGLEAEVAVEEESPAAIIGWLERMRAALGAPRPL